MSGAYYNEIEPFAAQWLRNLIANGLIAPGDVDERSICDVKADDLRGYTQCHFFAGISGWSLALRLAGWPDDRPVWTGSCPCQPFSEAGNRKGHADERHLWPEMLRLVRECRPPVTIGEQVSAAVRHGWLDGVFTSLEDENYACGAVIVGAHSTRSPHIRQRIYWVADAGCAASERDAGGLPTAEAGIGRKDGSQHGHLPERSTIGGATDRLADAQRTDARSREQGIEGRAGIGRDRPAIDGTACGLVNADGCGRRPQGNESEPSSGSDWTGIANPWSDFTIINCLDGKARRVPTQREFQPLAHGIPRELGRGQPELFRLARRARANRKGRLKGYGNAIVPQVAAEFIRAYMEIAA